MANLINNPNDYEDLYSGFDIQQVSAGLSQPGTYASPEYQKGKIQSLGIGVLSNCVYAAFDHDPNPLMLPFAYEQKFQTVLAFNLRYVPVPIRQQIIKFVLETNRNRISNNQPIQINYDPVEQAIPQVRGITRRYKIMFIGVVATPPIAKWPEIIRQPSPYQNLYKRFM